AGALNVPGTPARFGQTSSRKPFPPPTHRAHRQLLRPTPPVSRSAPLQSSRRSPSPERAPRQVGDDGATPELPDDIPHDTSLIQVRRHRQDHEELVPGTDD
ncbi:MAG: hypothetical protein LC808_01930, partial [Actinobacteria bacterium]|nr:hypothetical protein [Actinomycetota bacterium]